MKLEPGTRIGPYEIAGLIGEGGMGEVYRAHDERLQRDVALKLMSEDASGDATRMRRMQQEARAAGQLSHPNILGVFDVGTHAERMYVVTELLSGESLRDVVRRGPVPWRSALAYSAQVAEGLSAAHERGIIHRDIKPDNVFLTNDKRIKILDFGVATWRSPDGGPLSAATAATLSQAGLLVGTIGYMSPEQARGHTVDHRSDLFAFGCLLHELLAGSPAFTGATPMEILVAIQRDPAPPLHDIVPGVPADLVRIVDRCLEKDPSRRFQSARDLLFALTLIQTSGSATGRELAPAAAGSAGAKAPGASSGVNTGEPGRSSVRRRLRAAIPIALALLIGGAVTAPFRCSSPRESDLPSFRQITFRRGTVYTARFTLDGTGIVYSATWDGAPRELFATVAGTRDSRPLNHPETDAAFMLSTGEVSVIKRSRRGFSPGVLARMPLSDGPQKEMFDGVRWADGSPDGADVAVVKTEAGKFVLEMPPGRALADGPMISYPRISPDRTRVAYIENLEQVGDEGKLIVVDRSGKRTLETELWKSIEGLAWRRNDEIWFTASKEGRSLWMYALDMRGRTRLLCRVPGRLVLHDLFSDGRVVAERNSFRSTLVMGAAGDEKERDISWLDFSQLAQLSRDGKQVLFTEEGDGAGSKSAVYLRPVEGGVPLRLGDGVALALSADARRALLRVDDGGTHLEIVPVGPGAPERPPMGALTHISWAAFTSSGARLVILGKENGKGAHLYLQDLPSGEPHLLTPDEVDVNGDALSPDGGFVAATRAGKPALIPTDGGAIRDLPDLGDRVPVGWTSDGRALFVRTRSGVPVQLDRYDITSGKREPFRTLAPADPAGVLFIGRISVLGDGQAYVYENYRLMSDLYVIENLR